MAHRWAHADKTSPAALARKAKYNSAEHRAARAHYRKLVEYGLARCWRPDCRAVLLPGRWQVGHNDAGDQIMGPECRPCNLRHAAIKGNRIANARRKAARQVTGFVRVVR